MTWNRAEIRAARKTELGPVLERLGYRLEHIRDDNYRILGLPEEIIVKRSYWICTDDGEAGNAIDLLRRIENMPFSRAMELLRS